MNSRLTLADVRDALYSYVVPEDANSSKFTSYINQVRERIIHSGKWKGTTFTVAFDTSRGYLTLPRTAEALLAVHVSKQPLVIQSRWYEYLQSGPGQIDVTQANLSTVIDMGDNFCTLDDLSEPAQLVVQCQSADDNGLEIVIRGLDADGNQICSSDGSIGETVVLSTSPTFTVATFAQITSVTKPITVGNVTISQDAAPNPHILLSTYAPTETHPQYRRYKLGQTTQAVTGVCKLRYVPLVDDKELVIPDNLGAYKMGLQALTYEDSNDLVTAEQYWTKCFILLNNQSKEFRGAARYVPNVQLHPSGNYPIPTVI